MYSSPHQSRARLSHGLKRMGTSWNSGRGVAFQAHHLTSMYWELSKHLRENALLEPHSSPAVKVQLGPSEMKKPEWLASCPGVGGSRAGASGLPGVFRPRCPRGRRRT